MAIWYLVSPLYLSLFLSFFKSVKYAFERIPVGRGVQEGVLSQEHCEQYLKKHPDGVVKIMQKVGDMVHVPPGWLHAVFTLQATVKIAWDFMVPQSLPSYMAAWMHVGTRMKNTSDDCMGAAAVIIDHALSN